MYTVNVTRIAYEQILTQAVLSNGLVTPVVLGPWLQFTLQGFMAGVTTDEALAFKLFIILPLTLALLSWLHLL